MGDLKYCKSGKTQHKSMISAEMALDMLMKLPTKGIKKKKVGLVIYRCTQCKCLHVGHERKTFNK